MNYESKIQKICDLINNSELEKAESEICELEEYKPLKLSLIYAKAMLLYAKNRNPMEVFGYIDGKVLMNTFNYSDKYIPLMELLKKSTLTEMIILMYKNLTAYPNWPAATRRFMMK